MPLSGEIKYARNFDYFRLNEGMERVGVSATKLREWASKLDGPALIKMKGEQMVFLRYSEVEQYIADHSEDISQKGNLPPQAHADQMAA